MEQDDRINDLLQYTKALLVLHLQTFIETDERAKPEILLSRAGIPARDIAELLGKKPAAVVKMIQRARKT